MYVILTKNFKSVWSPSTKWRRVKTAKKNDRENEKLRKRRRIGCSLEETFPISKFRNETIVLKWGRKGKMRHEEKWWKSWKKKIEMMTNRRENSENWTLFWYLIALVLGWSFNWNKHSFLLFMKTVPKFPVPLGLTDGRRLYVVRRVHTIR